MATEATRLKLELIRDVNRSHISRFTIPSISNGNMSPVYSLDVGTRKGHIQVFRISSETGTDFTVSLKVIEAGEDYSVDEILRVEGITATGYQATNLGIAYSNEDEVANPDPNDLYFGGELPLLYLQISNVGDSLSTETGNVLVELVIEAGD